MIKASEGASRRTPPDVLAVDVGGTHVRMFRVYSDFTFEPVGDWPTASVIDPDVFLQFLVSHVVTLGEETGIAFEGVGIGLAGQIEPDFQTIQFAPNMGWRDFPLGRKLQEQLGIPVALDNDVRMAARGEWRFGAGRGSGDVLCVFIGTGIGGGVISGGRLYRGYHNVGGEIGHMTLVAGGRACHCPHRGCFEAYAGGWAIAERARERVQSTPDIGQPLLERAGSEANITAALVEKMALEGDPLCREIMDETVEYVASALVGLVNAFNPERLILGGGVIEGYPPFMEAVQQAIHQYALKAARRDVRVVRSVLGSRAIILGAADFIRCRLTAENRIVS